MKKNNSTQPNQIILPTDVLNVDDKVTYIVNRRVVAKGVLAFRGKHGLMQNG